MWPSVLACGWLRIPQRPGAQARRLPRLSFPKFGHGSPGGSCRRRHKREQRSSQAISVNCLGFAHPFLHQSTYESHFRSLQLAGERSSLCILGIPFPVYLGLPYQPLFPPILLPILEHSAHWAFSAFQFFLFLSIYFGDSYTCHHTRANPLMN